MQLKILLWLKEFYFMHSQELFGMKKRKNNVNYNLLSLFQLYLNSK